MKKIELLLVLTISTLLCLRAQDYQTVNSNRIAYFNNQYGNIRCIRIDTIKYLTDSVFYPFSSIQQLDWNCYTPYGSSWIGKKILIQDNGLNFFFNVNNDTIKIKTNALLNENWIAYELKDSIKVIAKVLKYDTLKFLGLQDSVKTIGFQVYDKTMTPINHNLNNKSVLVSKNYGFIKTLNFFLFPDFENSYPVEQLLEEYDLVGLSDPKLGVQNLKKFDVYDFNIGDELHVINFYSSWTFEGGGYAITNKIIFKYLDRKNYKDSIIYKIDKEVSTLERKNTWDNTSYSYYHDTIISIIKEDTLFDKIPGESIVVGSGLYSNNMENKFWLSKSPGDYYYLSFDSCWDYLLADGCLYTEYYYKGLGGPYYECVSNFIDFTSMSNDLIYYKKGHESWGTPLVLTNTQNNEKVEPLVYPNPSVDNFCIKLDYSGEYTLFELIDINGKIVLKKHLENAISTINVNEIIEGIYFFKIFNNNNLIATGKIILK
jgi:hypothetical protein